ncbi:EAL domain-containing protein [Pluralibacter gergoviae]|uniref:EAL domain-containing protein n=1 Tax=Pluralibacter gergoviae TaxID=61647 RepID=UPI00065141E9|nr:EAL domain-containing protein [Pluralibacter gergoviae]AMR39201.1 hypothetical protein LG71_25890 [Pluralibacter gergoviae]EKW6617253.1 EAL domain-containing protein [Pluralibacter gergoviae]ELN2739553.1 EAL domain-containing protein [Pluralibacter gergoviae]KMK33181.1 hypothetical protein ABW12_08460 [Pluralibacter gergoviae]MDU4005372.1 EAL domain-containing protein [Pluralibacter gergoviae]
MQTDNCPETASQETLSPPEEVRVTGFRLELIHFLRRPLHGVREVLSEVSAGGTAEDFFRDLSEESKKQLFCQQMASVLPLSGRYTLNLSVSMLADAAFVEQILAQKLGRKIIIEIQDPGSLLRLNSVEQQTIFTAVKRLSAGEYQVWLDDLYPEHLYAWSRSGLIFDAVKIDCHLFRQFSQSAAVFARLVRRYRDAGKMVVVEGVESIEDYIICLRSAADALQGYFFRQEWRRLSLH